MKTGRCFYGVCDNDLQEGFCVQNDYGIMRLKRCPKGKICKNGYCEEAPTCKKVGEKASTASECCRGIIDTNGICRGYLANESCNYNDFDNPNCDVGLFCPYRGVCTKLLQINETCTQYMDKCGPNMFCNRYKGKCEYLFSLSAGESAEQDEWCNLGSRQGYYCSSMLTLTSAEYISADKDPICKFSNSYESAAQCIIYSEDKLKAGHCRPRNDKKYKSLKAIRAYVEKYDTNLCSFDSMFCDNAKRTFNPCDMKEAFESMYSDILEEEKLYPSCWDKTFTLQADSFGCNNNPDLALILALSISGGVIFILGIILTIIGCKKRWCCKKEVYVDGYVPPVKSNFQRVSSPN